MTNNTPTAFGHYYRDEDYTQNKIVYVFHNEAYGGALWYRTFGGAKFAVEDDNLWLGPVPMPGGIGLHIGVNDRTGAPIHIGDELTFDPREWGGDCVFVLELKDGEISGCGTPGDWGEWCTVTRKWNEATL